MTPIAGAMRSFSGACSQSSRPESMMAFATCQNEHQKTVRRSAKIWSDKCALLVAFLSIGFIAGLLFVL
ncbi:hypothetical protein [Rhizobium sp. SL42]|uniref:hypothetical protein n=1 Tax=Rhizobium sp. SL42 TaxID=2806346 RepID=UPI001F32EEDC|nr:hypothetical protein [Rhizobium sp. SL42]UJW75032.1 hypothetical protein IM739_00435 [Rhizobium sp. SL42]